ncbi:MAG TPA: RHS repeat-associated core domain-containing protein [Acidobacteriota bacterium]|nr:RHS repeat-associated core domain-containing protein [Acidobacteriota bacterium]
MTVDAGGYVYVADTNNHRIRKIDPFGAVTTIAGTGVAGLKDGPSNEAQFDRPGEIALDPGGQLYVADAGNESIRRIGLDGVVVTVAGNGVGENPVQLKGLAGIAVERETVLVYLADQGRILRLDAEGNLLTVAGSGRGFSDGNGAEARFAEPAGLALDTTGTLIVADTANSLIREVLPEAAVRGDSLAVTTLAGTGERGTTDGSGQTAQFSQPRGVAVLSSSAILVADSGNHVLRKVVRPPVVEDFTPDRAAQAETIKLKGRQFDGRGPGYNAVDFAREAGGRTPATVTAATATELTVVVPDDAATGKVRVQTSGGLGESRREFQLGVPAGPVVMDFRPRFGPAGTLVTVTGKALQAGNEIPLVTFLGANGSRMAGQVTAATPGEIQVLVPDGAQTGVIEVTSAGAMGRSREMFQVDGFGYRLVGVPNTAFVLDGSETAFVIHVNAGGELFQSLVELKVKEAPQGVTATFDRKWITAGATATLKVAVAKGKVLPGSYKLTVEGEAAVGGGMVRREAVLTLQVKPLLRTALTGRVLSTEMEPIPGATVSLDGRSATTDGAGMFVLEGIEAGQNRPVMVDGRTATAPNRTYPVIVEPATVIFNRANLVPYTFFLPAIDTQYEVPVAPGQETIVTTPRVPGLKLTIPAEANLRNRDGSPVTRVSLTPVAIDRTPAPLPAGINLTMVFTAQPGGADSDVAMPASFPNLTGELPGTSFSLWNFNHDSAQWEVYGVGQVSPDGRTIEPDINPSTGKPFGLPYFSWFGPGRNLGDSANGPGPGGPYPGGGGDPANCPSCSSDNPVNFATGFKFDIETDLGWGGARGGLSLTRTHLNSTRIGRFGMGWTDNWTLSVSGSLDGFSASMTVSGQNRPWLMSLVRTEELEGAVEPVKVYESTVQAGMLGDELKYYPERSRNGINEPAFWEYRSKGGQRMKFNGAGRWESMSDRNGNTTVLSYDDRGRLVKVTDPVGRWIEFTYRAASRTPGTENQVVAVTDVMGRRWEYKYGFEFLDETPAVTVFRLEAVTDPLGHRMQYVYFLGSPILRQVIDKRGNVAKTLGYESTGRITGQRFADGGIEAYSYTVSGGQVTGVTITDPMGRVTSRRFNTAGYVIETTDELGQVRRVEREIGTNLPMATIGADGKIESQEKYDSRGNAVEMTDEFGHTRRMDYESVFNNLTKMVDKIGHETRMEYDEHGNDTVVINALGEITRFEYDQFGQLNSLTDGLGHTTRLSYDQYGMQISQTDPLGNQMTYEYNVFGWPLTVTDGEGRHIVATYDKLGRVVQVKDASGAVRQIEYDENGNLITQIDPFGRVWRNEFDVLNRLTRSIDPLGREEQVQYNFNDEVLLTISPSGRIVRYDYDSRGLVKSKIDPESNQVNFSYDSEGNLISIADKRGYTHSFQYDELGRLIEAQDPSGKSRRRTYDVEGNLKILIDRLGRQMEIEYDALNRPFIAHYPDAEVTWEYDAAGRVIRLTDSQGGEILYTFDDADRFVSEQTSTGVIHYQYNQANQRTQLRIPGQSPVLYRYDEAGRIQSITQENNIFLYGYDLASRLTSIQRPNGIITTYSYDDVHRLKTLTHKNQSNQIVDDFHFSYTSDDEISAHFSSFTGINLPEDQNMGMADPMNRINQLDTTIYSFDAIGQPMTKTDERGITRFEWDTRGRLTRVTTPQNQEIKYTYDAVGRRTQRQVGNMTTSFLYDGSEVVADLKNDGKRVDYLNQLGTDQKLVQRENNQPPLFFLPNHQQSTIALTDSKGDITQRIRYEAFGKTQGSALTRYTFTGREFEESTGLIYYRARWYDPQHGRFLTEDPLRFQAGINFYTYTSNNPILLNDPFGLQSQMPSGVDQMMNAGCEESADEAARKAFIEIFGTIYFNNGSLESEEFGGFICCLERKSEKTPCYIFTPPQKLGSGHVGNSIGLTGLGGSGTLRPNGEKACRKEKARQSKAGEIKVVAWYHTHGYNSPKNNKDGTPNNSNEFFSSKEDNGDIALIDSTGLTGYLATPRGKLLVRYPHKRTRTICTGCFPHKKE